MSVASKADAPAASKSTNVVDANTSAQNPPPETSVALWTRRWVVLSFWAVVILLGFPTWWRTTMVYRAALPLDAMNQWSDGKLCQPVFPLRVAVEAPSMTPQEAQNLLRNTEHILDFSSGFRSHQLQLVLTDPPTALNASIPITGVIASPGTQEEETILRVRLTPTESIARVELQTHSAGLDVYYTQSQLASSASASPPLATLLAEELQNVYREERATLASILESNPSAVAPELSEALAKQSTRAFKYAPTYHLTFSLFTPNGSPSDWEIESALKEYIEPLLETLSVISTFTVDTQVQVYATFSPAIRQPEYDEDRKSWTLQQEDLSGFINAAEWPLSPSIGTGPTINFALYVPSPDQSPLVVKQNGGNSWLVPQWGGVLILNPDQVQGNIAVVSAYLSKEALRSAMLTFSNQLLSLLGLPDTPASLPLRISTLTRVRAATLILSASSTLGALARLTQQLSSIAIPDSVAGSVDLTLNHLESACNALKSGRFQTALEHSRIAETEAEKAFFERSMVAMVYFPDEHKVAVYLPLLGPVAVPLVMALIKELKALVRLLKQTKS